MQLSSSLGEGLRGVISESGGGFRFSVPHPLWLGWSWDFLFCLEAASLQPDSHEMGTREGCVCVCARTCLCRRVFLSRCPGLVTLWYWYSGLSLNRFVLPFPTPIPRNCHRSLGLQHEVEVEAVC